MPTSSSLNCFTTFTPVSTPSPPYPIDTTPCSVFVSACATSTTTLLRAPHSVVSVTIWSGDSACCHAITPTP